MEVEEAFLSSLLAVYANLQSHEVEDIDNRVKKALNEKDSQGLQKSLTELFANIPYNLVTERESSYHLMFLIVARLSGFKVHGEEPTDKGRMDASLTKDNSVIVVEMKYSKEKAASKMIKKAIKQIRDMKYYEKYIGDNVSLLAIAVGDKKEIACKFETL
jgi:2,3-bisphosphoglycerate-independent phosphoglycerate mutase